MLVLTPIAFVRPLGLDSFAVAAAIGCHHVVHVWLLPRRAVRV
jgi:hypothetical protein